MIQIAEAVKSSSSGREPGFQGPAQEVVSHRGGPLLVVGGPGTGKTYSLEQRYLDLASHDVGLHRVLFLCNNRRYAVAARDRLVWSLPDQATIEVPVYTWHALAYHLVARNYPEIGFDRPPVLLTAPEQWGMVRELMADETAGDWQDWAPRMTERAFIDEVADFCLRAQQRLISTDDIFSMTRARPEWRPLGGFFSRYLTAMKRRARLDYSGLIAAAVTLLEGHSAVREAIGARFPHVLIDDGQELSRAHLKLLKLLECSNLVVAADGDSGVETFRGAEPDWIFGFDKLFGPSRTIQLGASGRVGSPLAKAAADLIQRNHPSGPSYRLAPADHITDFECLKFHSVAEETAAVAREFRRLHLIEQVPWEQMAILVSQPRHLLGPLERALGHWEVPFYSVMGDRPLAGEPVISCFLDLARASLCEDDGTLLAQVLTSRLVGLGFGQRRELEREAWRKGLTLAQLVEETPAAAEFRKLRDLIRSHASSADECFWEVYQAASYYKDIEQKACSDSGDPAHSLLDALVAFSRSLERFVERRHEQGSMLAYLSEATRADFGGDPWMAPPLEGEGKVQVLSFHGAKGREWEVVAVMGCLDAWMPKGTRAQGLFDPFTLETPDPAERQIEAIADDRRTFYVAATRARRKVIFTVSPASGGRARPSRFLSELSDQPVAEAEPAEVLPLTLGEMAAVLRRTLASAESAPEQRLAAVLALAELPEASTLSWYGRWEWTAGAAPLIDGELRTSYSRLGVFDNCALQYVLQSVLGLDPSSTHSMKFGTWLHALFQAVHEGKIKDAATLRAEYAKLFDSRIFPNPTIAKQFQKDGEKMLKVFWENEAGAPTVKAEHEFAFEYSGAVLRGRIDRIDKSGNALKLIDYKTAKWAPSRPQAERSLQLAIYHLAAKMDPELQGLGDPRLAQLVYPGSLWPDGRHKTLSQNAEQAQKVVDQLPEMIAKVKAEEFNPSPSADCYFCRMKPLCPLWPEGREVIA